MRLWNKEIENYLGICLEFAHESSGWLRLDDTQFYVATPTGWCESCNNACGGIDVSWAFKLSDDEIKGHATEMFYQEFLDEVQCMIDNDCDLDGFQKTVDKFRDF